MHFRTSIAFDAAVVVSVIGTVMMGLLASVYLSHLRAAYALGQSIAFGIVKVVLAAVFVVTQGGGRTLGREGPGTVFCLADRGARVLTQDRRRPLLAPAGSKARRHQ